MINKMTPLYLPNYINEDASINIFNELLNLDWLSVTEARREYFMANESLLYNYSNRDYIADPFIQVVKNIQDSLNEGDNQFNVCFLNKYDSYKDQLGWHSDSSPEMNTNHPICVISFGQEREIWYKHKDQKGDIPNEQKIMLGNGSLFIMPSHFQEEYLHKIPRHFSQDCGTRISLTFRNYIKEFELIKL